MTTTTTKEKFECKYCERKFDRVQELATHVRLDHKAERAKAIAAGEPPRKNRHNERTPQPVIEEGQRLTKRGILDRFPGILKRIHNLGGCKVAFEKFPQWKVKLTARGEPMQSVYDALTMYRKSIGAIAPKTPNLEAANQARIKVSTGEVVAEKPKRGKQKRKQWSKEQYDLARAIIDDPQWRMVNGTDVDWERVMRAHPSYEQVLEYRNETFKSFVQRVRRGGGTRVKSKMSLVPVETAAAAEPLNGQAHHGILILGREYGLTDLERILKHYKELRHHLKACPECGYNLKEHTHCYNIVKRHMETARIEDEI